MTGLSEFEKLFGSITILNVIEFALAVIFMVLIFTKIKDYIVVRHDAAKLKDEQLKTALEAVSHYPEYRAQSIKVQKELEEKIEELKRSQDANTERLKIMEESQKKLERNKLRDRILQSYRYFTDKDRNPAQTWNRMEAEAFWELIGEYEKRDGDGYVHTVVIPAMNLLTVVEMNELLDDENERSAE